MLRSFYEEQARYRRATWRWTALSAAAAVVMGLPLSLVLTPAIYLIALIVIHLIAQLVPVPSAIWNATDAVATLIPQTIAAYEQGIGTLAATVMPQLVALILPGALAIVAVWAAVKRLLETVSLDATLKALSAREPQDAVLEEQQFRNTVDEIAIAAGIPTPQVWITEQLSPNMALVGSALDHAGIVVSRRLLNTCDRGETQALVAHLIASLVHDDLVIAIRIESVYLTGAALNALVNAPFGSAGRRGVAALARALFRRATAIDATKALATLLQEWGTPSNDLTRFLERDTSRPPSVWRQLLHLLLLPLYLLNMAVMVIASLLEAGLVSPMLSAVWRARRYLADASAVELTRSPTQLARALHNIGGALGDPHWAPARLHTVVASDVANPLRNPGGLTNAHPPIEKRIRRLAAQGAVITWEPHAVARSGLGMLSALGTIVVVPLLALMAYMMAMVVALVTVLSLGTLAVTLAAIHGIFWLLQ